MTQEHRKHSDITRPDYGSFHRQEWAIVGAPCGEIKQLASGIIQRLRAQWQLAYVDAAHQSSTDTPDFGDSSFLGVGAQLEFTDKIHFHRIDRKGAFSLSQQRLWFNEVDAALVNGNHFSAKRQIVVLDTRKEASLLKRLPQLTQVDLVLVTEGCTELYPFLAEHLEKQAARSPVVLPLLDVDAIADFIQNQLDVQQPPLQGLVLAGGKSVRMGADKGALDYHGMPQREYAAQLLSAYCTDVFISVRPEQEVQLHSAFRLLPDTFIGLGPMGAILSAFRSNPNVAWLVVACDLPMLNQETLGQLVENRQPGAMATAFNSPVNAFPEPLIAIWEPRSYPVLLQYLGQGYSCPRKVLINNPVHLLDAHTPDALTNVNNPEELQEVRNKIANKT